MVQCTAALGGLTCQLAVTDSKRGAVAVSVKFSRTGHEITPRRMQDRGTINIVSLHATEELINREHASAY